MTVVVVSVVVDVDFKVGKLVVRVEVSPDNMSISILEFLYLIYAFPIRTMSRPNSIIY